MNGDEWDEVAGFVRLFTLAQDFAKFSNHSATERALSLNRFAMPYLFTLAPSDD
jgi:hypothetical protein